MQSRLKHLFWATAVGLLVTGAPCLANEAGEQLYAQQCVRCHGQQGAGTEDYPSPLAGDLSVDQLAEQIRLTMPADNPESLTRDQAQNIARYVHDSFYSAIARARLEPPAIELARLTVNQYRQVTADLVGSFLWQASIGDERGLSAEYYGDRNPKGRDKAALTRTDATIDFQFGTEVPVPEIEDPFRYSMRWKGVVLPTETGWHEFIVRTEHACRLWVNDNETAVIDRWVKSGDDDEYRAKVYLLGGRAYPLKLEFSRGTQGVSDEKLHEKYKKVSEASIQLMWAPPMGAEQVIPTRCLAPFEAPPAYACTTHFPPDDRSYGWERGTAVSQSWFDATTAAAIETATYVCDRLNRLAGTNDKDEQRREKLQQFCHKFAERAFRRPLNEELRQRYVDQHFEQLDDEEVATRRALLMTLTSPRFLFREASGGDEPQNTAARLALSLWDSLPDEELRSAAAEDRLSSDDALRDQASRMLADPRARRKLRQFLFTWLQVDSVVDLHKNSERYPQFDAHTVADLRTSLDLLLDEVVWSDDSDYRRLFLTDEVFLNQRLAQFYGLGGEPPADFAKARLDDGERAGVITHPYVMSKFAHSDVTSPIHRGVFLVRGVMGHALKPPPEAIAPLSPDLHPDLTTRERVTLQTQPPACMTCHHLINPLGFTLERFDAVGRLRDTEQDKPIDDRGEYQPQQGPAVSLSGARELAEFLADSDEVSQAFTEQMFRYLVQQSLEAYGPAVAKRLHESFVESNYSIRQLAVEVAVVSSRVGRDDDLASQASK